MAGTLAGCASGTPERAAAAAGHGDQACAAEAKARADDAAINGYDADLVERVTRDSYGVCMALKKIRVASDGH